MWLFSLLMLAHAVALVAGKCSMYLIPSSVISAGRGIVAGVSYEREVEIESNPTLPIPKALSQKTQLSHYVYATGNSKYDMAMIGPASIYNHRDHRTVYYSWKDYTVPDPSLSQVFPYTNFTHTTFKSMTTIEEGAEMFNYYGDSWFSRFESSQETNSDTLDTSHKFSTDDLEQFGHCLTEITINTSSITSAGLGVFANRTFEVGEIVTISPVVALSKEVVDEHTQDTVLANYCFATPNSTVVLFPINYGAMINNNSTGSEANVKVEWYDWSPAVEALTTKYPHTDSHTDTEQTYTTNQNLRLVDKLQMTAEELYSAPFAQLDVAYRATQRILKGQEILLDYGPAWQTAWSKYAQKMLKWNFQQENEKLDNFPLFRAYIAAPEGMFPEQWTDQSQQQCNAGVDNGADVCML